MVMMVEVRYLLYARGDDFYHEIVRLGCNRIGLMFTAEIRGRVNHLRGSKHWRWRVD